MIIYIPDGTEEKKAIARTTHLAISAHQDDIEFMAYAPIAECFGKADKWFSGVVVTDGSGSPRSGLYADYTDEEMKEVRITEQKKAAAVGEYSFQMLLGYPSKEVKDPKNTAIIKELAEIIRQAKPKYLYTHNLADKHETHVATALKVIAALRTLSPDERPEKIYGCEVWRDLDWVNDEEKIYMDCGPHPNLMRCLSAVFDSQIVGGKRYDLAAEGRRLANATFSASHACDTYTALNYAMDLTPLMDEKTDIAEYIAGFIERFKQETMDLLNRFYMSDNKISMRHFTVDEAQLLHTHQYPNKGVNEIIGMIGAWNTLQYQGKYFEMFALCCKGKVVGSISLFERGEKVIGIAPEIYGENRRKGYATVAMTQAMRYAYRRGYRIVIAQVRKENEASLHLLKKLGYTVDHEYVNGNGNEVVCLIKVL